MKALVLTDYKKFELQTVSTPEVAADNVLVRIKACGICGSDVHGMDGSSGRRRPPIIMGHEASGIVENSGSAASEWKPGDRVTFDSTIYCGQCDSCRAGHVNLCSHRRVLGVSCDAYRQNGAFAEFVSVPKHILYRLPEKLSYEAAALVEPLSIAFHAVNRAGNVSRDSALVVGAGMIGLLLVQTLRMKGFGKIVAVDVAADKLALAKQLGATHVINSGHPGALEEIQSLTGGHGVQVAFEAVGIAPTLELAIGATRTGGTVVLVGNVTPRPVMPLQLIVGRELNVLGSCASSGEYPACLEALASDAISVQPLISKVAPLEDGAEWFSRLYGKEPGLIKVLLQP